MASRTRGTRPESARTARMDIPLAVTVSHSSAGAPLVEAGSWQAAVAATTRELKTTGSRIVLKLHAPICRKHAVRDDFTRSSHGTRQRGTRHFALTRCFRPSTRVQPQVAQQMH